MNLEGRTSQSERKKSFLIVIVWFLIISIIALSGCSTSPVRYVRELSYIEWRDDNGIFKFRATKNGMHGCGTILLNGEEIPASYDIGTNKPYFSVNISIETAEKLCYDLEYHTSGGVAFDGFEPDYSEKDKVITSLENDVELFGIPIGKVRLKAYPVDKSAFVIWEIRSTWSDDDNKLRIDNDESNYFLYQCLRAKATLPNGQTKDLTFRYLTETSGFRIYADMDEQDYENIFTDEIPQLAGGAYELDGDNVILHFTQDKVLGLEGQSLSLTERA